MPQEKEWLLIVDKQPLSGSLNMAVDDYLFQSLGEKPQTYLRFYCWERPTVSLGYSQNIQKVVDVDYCRRKGIDIVRRMTGGKLVLHYKEATYSVASSDIHTFGSSLADSYRLISLGLMRGLEKMGLEPYLAGRPPDSYARGNLPCFSFPARNEIEVRGKKIVGSAQKRSGSKFIQHGSIPLEGDEGFLESVSFLKGDKGKLRIISLSEALGRPVDFQSAVERLISGMAEFFGVQWKAMVFGDRDKEAIIETQKRKYANHDWTFSRREIQEGKTRPFS